MKPLRWSFNVTQWIPTKEQLIFALECIQSEEIDRIYRFAFKDSFKSSLIGRLLLRKALVHSLNLENTEIFLTRTEKGKPILTKNIESLEANIFNSINSNEIVKNNISGFDFNISHQGDFCVLALDQVDYVGIDVMRIEKRYQGSLQDYFRLMKRQFAETEWNFIRQASTEQLQLARFIRLWCLKESYVKATAEGITIDLTKIEFQCPTKSLSFGHDPLLDTKVKVNGKILSDWTFEESMIDENHCACVATCKTTLKSDKRFKEMHFENLLEGLKPFRDLSTIDYYEKYLIKNDR